MSAGAPLASETKVLVARRIKVQENWNDGWNKGEGSSFIRCRRVGTKGWVTFYSHIHDTCNR